MRWRTVMLREVDTGFRDCARNDELCAEPSLALAVGWQRVTECTVLGCKPRAVCSEAMRVEGVRKGLPQQELGEFLIPVQADPNLQWLRCKTTKDFNEPYSATQGR